MEQQAALPNMAEFEKKDSLTLSMPAHLFELVKSGANADAVAKLWEVHKEWVAFEAKAKFDAAFEQFKKNVPEILKTKEVKFPTNAGGRMSYWHAELDKMSDILTEALRAVGITQTWKCSDVNGRTTVTCILSGFGHTHEGSTLSGPPDTSGGKNNIQAIGSTTRYLQRYTLESTCGVVPKGVDDDGKTEGLPEDSIVDYCVKMQDCVDFEELKGVFKECWEKAKANNDSEARDRFRTCYEACKRELANGQR